MTRQHTVMHHGGNTGYEKLKRVVLEFTNNVAGSDSAMQVDQIAETFNEEHDKNTQGQTQRHGRDQEQGSSTSARSVRELVSATTARVMATLRASVPPRARAKQEMKGTPQQPDPSRVGHPDQSEHRSAARGVTSTSRRASR